MNMANTAQINIKSDQGFHRVFLRQDASAKRTIHSLVDDIPHAVVNCAASADGATLSGDTSILIFTDRVLVTVDPATGTVRLTISGAGVDWAGILTPEQATAMITFVKACGLPDLAEAP
jgi:hypothetical protein